jgi:hypothetical protein
VHTSLLVLCLVASHTHRRPRRLARALTTASLALGAASCGYSVHPAGHAGAEDHAGTVRVTLTPGGCQPVPSRVSAGTVDVMISNLDAPTVSEVEIRSSSLSQVIGERENLIEGLSATLTLQLQQGTYFVSCPGAAKQYWPLTILRMRA